MGGSIASGLCHLLGSRGNRGGKEAGPRFRGGKEFKNIGFQRSPPTERGTVLALLTRKKGERGEALDDNGIRKGGPSEGPEK